MSNYEGILYEFLPILTCLRYLFFFCMGYFLFVYGNQRGTHRKIPMCDVPKVSRCCKRHIFQFHGMEILGCNFDTNFPEIL